ncbi:MAG TPA: trypsin-like serine protease [Usitatibacter sp.]|nr:trypsin-like serine protease [Usitatibacter sp.]
MIRISSLALAACCWVLPAAAIVIRTDRDDAEYLELASRYTSSVPLGAAGGEGVLISARWVLTAAHRAQAIKGIPDYRLRVGTAEHEVESVVLHPRWKPGDTAHDIALVQLRTDVRGIEFTPVQRVQDEAGATVVFAAHGNPDGKKRAAINTVDHVGAYALGLDLKPLDAASDLQGGLMPNETGAPLFLQAPDGLSVAGIAAFTDGKRDTYTRVSAYAGWVDSVLLDAAKRAAEKLLGAE